MHNILGLQSLKFIVGRWVLIMMQLLSTLLTEFQVDSIIWLLKKRQAILYHIQND